VISTMLETYASHMLHLSFPKFYLSEQAFPADMQRTP